MNELRDFELDKDVIKWQTNAVNKNKNTLAW